MQIGDRIPGVTLARISDGAVEQVALQPLLAGGRAVIVGVVGAFTPVCTDNHAPEFVTKAQHLRSMGYRQIVCLAPNDPWTVDAWARQLGAPADVLFLSDGNLDFARALGVTVMAREHHLGERPRRYLLLTRDNVIERLTVEPDVTNITCTGVEAVERES